MRLGSGNLAVRISRSDVASSTGFPGRSSAKEGVILRGRDSNLLLGVVFLAIRTWKSVEISGPFFVLLPSSLQRWPGVHKEDKMKHISVFVALSILSLIIFPARAAIAASDEEMRNDVVGLFGALLTPSVFTAASMENLSLSVYGRRVTGEGEVPDFDKKPADEINEMELFLSGRLGGLGLTLGFGQGSDFEFSQPVILAIDYKTGFLEQFHGRHSIAFCPLVRVCYNSYFCGSRLGHGEFCHGITR